MVVVQASSLQPKRTSFASTWKVSIICQPLSSAFGICAVLMAIERPLTDTETSASA